MENEELQQWIEQVSLDHFGVPFTHEALFNSRLTTTGALYAEKSPD